MANGDLGPDWEQGGYFLDVAGLGVGDAILRVDQSPQGPGWLLFRDPSRVLIGDRTVDVPAVLETAGRYAETAWVVGCLEYEAATALHPKMSVRDVGEGRAPLAWFAVYDEAPRFYRELAPVYDAPSLGSLAAEWDFVRYAVAFREVKAALARGDSYQVNLTFRQRFSLARSPAELFVSRCGVRPPRYAAFIHGGDWQIASFSPELMFERVGDDVVTEPMKGTAAAPLDRSDCERAAAVLRDDPKSVAENIMIVDMARNDLGSICATGSVKTPELLQVARHRGLLQMTSRVTGRCAAPSSVLLSAIFPAASITGAPKVATTRIISQLETSPRRIYCGAIGVMAPGWQRFSVAIRTVLAEKAEGGWSCEFGVGSGVVWDSEVDAEYRECLAKNDVLLNPAPQWELVEVLALRDLDLVECVDRHLARLKTSADRFGVVGDFAAIRTLLAGLSRSANPSDRAKVRIALRRSGEFSISVSPSFVRGEFLRGTLATEPVRASDPNLRVKTNSRAVLDGFLDRHPTFDEVLLYNEAGLITEFCYGNAAVRIGGRLLTPRPESGCLAGIGIARLVASGEAEYSDIPVSALDSAEAMYFVNSVVGLVPVRFETLARSNPSSQ